ncbi:MAG: 6,7-dimethyl-8-ribityllumazine synthase [Puniceicoccales bacterium]|jgi:6,7-dimethyl-8-ribityllumazine synthase|nr:6,7-dimethyl-8-ribityllumazine synthase [Puniceicoccales bacterium]
MSQDKPATSAVDGADIYIGIVAARYNNELVEALIKRARATLRKARVQESSIKVLRVPGAAELPYVVNMLAQTDEYDCIIALGVIIAGDTQHHEVLANSTAVALQGIALQSEVPVINGVLTVNNRAQAEERVTGAMDRGAEFANAALEMAWHRVHLGDYLEALDAEADKQELEAEQQQMEAGSFPGFSDDADDDDDDEDEFGDGRSPFHKN